MPSLLAQMAFGKGVEQSLSQELHMSFCRELCRQGMTGLEWKSLLCDNAIG